MPNTLDNASLEAGQKVYGRAANTDKFSEILSVDTNNVLQLGASVTSVNAAVLKIAGTALTATAAEINALAGVGLSTAELGYLDGVTAGTVIASKALVVGTNKNVDVLVIADGGFKLGSGAGTAVDATALEINRVADVSTRMVAAGATLAVTEALHAGRIIKLDTITGSICTLPAATGGGSRYRFIISAIATSNSHIVKVANASDTMVGNVLAISDDAGNTVKPFFAAGTDDTITLNRTTSGSTRVAEWVELLDLAANLWAVSGVVAQTGAEITPFSATV